MKRPGALLPSALAAALLVGACGGPGAGLPQLGADPARSEAVRSEPPRSELASTGRNPYFILEPGYQLVLEGGGEQVTITVLNETKIVDGVETRVVEERETDRGRLTEISRNYFAINTRTNDVLYFGEDVDKYRDGRVVNHEGAWLSGVGGAKFGVIMPGTPALNVTFQQETAPGVAMDRGKVVGMSETVRTPAGEFTGCLKVEETTPLEPGVVEFKYHARDIGLVQDGSLKLVRFGKKP
jgi:hypothetical protein